MQANESGDEKLNTLDNIEFETGDGWYHASVIAAKSFSDRHKENAVFKFQLAREIFDVHPMNLQP